MSNSPSGGIGIERTRIISTFDIQKPEVRNQLFRTRGDQGLSIFNKLETLGYVNGVSNSTQKQYEEDWIHQVIHVKGTTFAYNSGTGVGSFDLDNTAGASDYLALSTSGLYVNSTAVSSYVTVQKGDVILAKEMPAANMIVTNVAISGGVATVTFLNNDTTKTITTGNYPAGTVLSVFTQVSSEGSKQPRGLVTKPLIDYAYLQIIKTGFNYTGTQATDRPWFDTYKSAGDIESYVIKGQWDSEYEHMLKMDGALLFARPSTNTNAGILDTTTDEPYLMTEGLVPYIERTGNLFPYTSGTVTVGMFDAIVKILDREFAPRYIDSMLGIDLDIEMENVLKAYFQNTDTSYLDGMETDIFDGSKAKRMSVGFNAFEKAGRVFCFNRLPSFNHPKLYGATGYKYPKVGLFVPIGAKTDTKTGVSLPYFGMLYKTLGKYSRKAEVWTINGAAPGNLIVEDDLNLLCMRSHIGAQHVGGNHMIKMYEPV